MIGGVGEKSTQEQAIELVKSRYAKDETDEFLKPIVFSDEARIKGMLFMFTGRAKKPYFCVFW
jgi:2,3-bisphosphoglycerate-independent phosphoglycerate mutase